MSDAPDGRDEELRVDDPTVAALRGALAREAATIEGRPDGLLRVRAAIEAEQGPGRLVGGSGGRWGRRRRPMAFGLAAAAACVALVAGLLIGSQLGSGGRSPVGGPGPTTGSATSPAPTGGSASGPATGTPSGPATGSPTGAATGSPSGAGGFGGALPVYYPAPVGAGFGLYREYHQPQVELTGTADRVRAALQQAMSRAPDDPDYRLFWDEAAEAAVTVQGDLITVRLNQAAAGGTTVADPGADVIAVQQLIWTATAAAVTPGVPGPFRVLLRADGPTPTRFGGVDLSRPFERGPQPGAADPRAPLWIDSPAEGDLLGVGSRRVTGQGIGGPFVLRWTLERDGAVVGSGTVRPTTAGGGRLAVGVRGVWALDLPLDRPGSYRLEVVEDVPVDAGGGADSKSFVVR